MLTTLWIASFWTSVVAATSLPSFDKRQANSAIAASSFRRRGYQSVATLGNYAYIDGGEFSYSTNGDIDYNYSNNLIAIDLTQNFTNASVTLNTISKPSGVPDLQQGGIWVNKEAKELYIGFAGRRSIFGDDARQTLGLWSFRPDGQGGGNWNNLSGQVDSDFDTQPRQFASLVASGGGKGYSLGGFFLNASSGDPAAHDIAASGMIVYDYSSKKRTNMTVSGTPTDGTVQMGGMVHVPNFGKQGILVAAGGDSLFSDNPDGDTLLDFTTVNVFDVDSSTWYTQQTTGNVPGKRKEFCMTGVASTNQTYEILVYAGWGGNLGAPSVPYDEAYILTLPGFQWFKAPYPAAHPRHAVSCVPVGGGQILTVGGVDSTISVFNNKGGLYYHVFDSADPFTQGLNVFDMNALAFTTSYSADPPAYTGAKAVQNYYNSNPRTPQFSSGLGQVFAVQNFNATTTNNGGRTGGGDSNSNGNGPSHAGAIAGGIVGGLAGLAIIAVLALYIIPRFRKKNKQKKINQTDSENQMSQSRYGDGGDGIDHVASGAIGAAALGASAGGGGGGLHEADAETSARYEAPNVPSQNVYPSSGGYAAPGQGAKHYQGASSSGIAGLSSSNGGNGLGAAEKGYYSSVPQTEPSELGANGGRYEMP